MDIKQEDFDKLKQLDRIEYRQKEDKIRSWMDESCGLIFLQYLVLVAVIALLLLPQTYVAFGIESLEGTLEIIGFGMGVFIILAALGFMLDVIFFIIRQKNLKELKEEYFKIEVKK